MSIAEIGLLLVAVLSGAAGQAFLKLGALKLGKVTADNAFGLVLTIVTIPELMVGLAAYGFGAIAYILLLTRVNLSIAGPAAASVYVFSVLLGYFLFKEVISPLRLIGMGMIVCGVVLVASKT